MSAPAGDGRCGCGCHRRVGSRPLDSLDDDLLSFLEAINNASRVRRHLAEAHPALPGDILIVHDIHVIALLIGEDGAARHGDDQLRLHGFKKHGDELVGHKLTKVDTAAKTISIKTEQGGEMKFTYTDATKVVGADGVAGLATTSGAKVIVPSTCV